MLYCPGDTTLRLLGADILSEETYLAVEQHVEGCARCKRVLERLAQRHGDAAGVDHSIGALPRVDGFEMIREIDRGAMGVVYQAVETELGRPVALKMISSGIRADAASDARRQWMREARAASRVRHPNLVPLYGYGEANGRFFLVLEYVAGGSLKNRLDGPVPAQAAAKLLETIARAIGCIHGHGLFHLDLKPSNILLDGGKEGSWEGVTPRVSDFGLATMDGGPDLSEQSLAVPRGTPSYMAPEQANADRSAIGAGSDIYGLGAILYELLTGRPPFQGASMVETLDQVRRLTPVAPRRLNPKIPRDLETITLKCLEKTVSRRYDSAEALANDLRRWLDGKAIVARPLSPVGNAWRWCQRQPVIAGLTVSLIATLFGGVLGLWTLLVRSEALRLRADAQFQAASANYEVASRSLDELLDLFQYTGTAIWTDSFPKDQGLQMLRNIRVHELGLSQRYGPTQGGLRRLARIAGFLSTYPERQGKYDEARALAEESIEYWERCLALKPRDSEFQLRQLNQCLRILNMLFDSNDDALYRHWDAKAVSILSAVGRGSHSHTEWPALELSRCHHRRAKFLVDKRQRERARRVLEADLKFVRSADGARNGCPRLALREALCCAALGKWKELRRLTASKIPSQEPGFDRLAMEEGFLELNVRRLGWLESIDGSLPFDIAGVSANPWPERLVSMMRSDAVVLELDPKQIPEKLLPFSTSAVERLTMLRSLGHLDEACRVANYWVALAERMTQDCPDHADAYLKLSKGYVQMAKNAYRCDAKSVLECERKALEAALKAERLDPKSEEARTAVEWARGRVLKATSK